MNIECELSLFNRPGNPVGHLDVFCAEPGISHRVINLIHHELVTGQVGWQVGGRRYLGLDMETLDVTLLRPWDDWQTQIGRFIVGDHPLNPRCVRANLQVDWRHNSTTATFVKLSTTVVDLNVLIDRIAPLFLRQLT